MDRVILHSDCNCFYASVEMLHQPGLRNVPMAVGGDPQARHGIILTANYIAKRRGVKTGMALWEARQVCPDIIFVPPDYDKYLRFSKLTHEIYADYSDLQEAFGLDECWIDVTDSRTIRGNGRMIAEEIRERVKRELGITVSVGISWNKIFAKFGSDYKKPDAVTEITRENYKEIIWKQPVEDLLYVGRATQRKLNRIGIMTIGDLAETDPITLKCLLGKMGLVLSAFARGEDRTPVSKENTEAPIKSVGNSTTTPKDLTTYQNVHIVVYLLAESVAERLRKNGFVGDVVEISVRDNGLYSFTRQRKIDSPTNISAEIAGCAMRLFHENYRWQAPIRSIGVRVSHLQPDSYPYQLDLFTDPAYRERQLKMDKAVQVIRRRFGYAACQRGVMYFDRKLSSLDAKADDHMIHPHSYFERGNRSGVSDEEYAAMGG